MGKPTSSAASPVTPAPAPPVEVVVSFPMGTRAAPLGLDRPLRLLGGGEVLRPEGLASTFGIDHVPGLRTFVAEAARGQALDGNDWYRQPPLVLLGDEGSGRSFVSAWIARNAGLPLFRMPVRGNFAAGSATPNGQERPLPVLPLLAMASSVCANPIVIVELDLDDLPEGQSEAALIRMIDPRRNSRWMDVEHDAFFDLGRISWILEVRNHVPPSRTDHDTRPNRADVMLPPALSDLISDVGSTIVVDCPNELHRLQCLDVAFEVCAEAGRADRATVGAVYDAVHVRHPHGRGDRWCDREPKCGTLVAEAKRALATYGNGVVA